MASSRRADRLLFLPLALLHLLSCCPHTASGAPNTAPLSVLCNGAAYGAGDPFAESLAYVLADLLAATPQSRSRDAYSVSPLALEMCFTGIMIHL
ncbi:antifungal protein ginkbilobin-2-like [Hordeum vulgare]|nr:antifungal protein ginkbilobin-2-like [Hordeum vulgare]